MGKCGRTPSLRQYPIDYGSLDVSEDALYKHFV